MACAALPIFISPQRLASRPPMRISNEYREANKRLHELNPKYGSSTAKATTRVLELVGATGSRSVLDYGCGKGNLAAALPNIDVRQYNPRIPCTNAEPHI